MSEQKINEGDMVTTKPMKAWLNFDDAATVKVTMHSGRIEWFNRADLIPIPATDADVVVKARHLVEILEVVHDHPSYLGVFQMAAIHGTRYKGPTYEAALHDLKAALTALTSSGYTCSPKPDVWLPEEMPQEFAAMNIARPRLEQEGRWKEFRFALMRRATPAPQKPAVNQMMLEALLDAIDTAIKIANDEGSATADVEESWLAIVKARLAIAAGSEE